jgi:hypothetical protein
MPKLGGITNTAPEEEVAAMVEVEAEVVVEVVVVEVVVEALAALGGSKSRTPRRARDEPVVGGAGGAIAGVADAVKLARKAETSATTRASWSGSCGYGSVTRSARTWAATAPSVDGSSIDADDARMFAAREMSPRPAIA